MSVFLQRLEEEYGVAVIPTAPTVPYLRNLQLQLTSRLERSNSFSFQFT
jgi:translation elongation factor EF-4